MTYAMAQYLNVRQAFHPSFSSDGRRLVFLTNITGDPQLWQIALSDRGVIPWPDQITFEADRVMGVWCSPAPADDHLIFARDMGGNENAQLFLLSAQGVVTSLTAGTKKRCTPLANGRALVSVFSSRPIAAIRLYSISICKHLRVKRN